MDFISSTADPAPFLTPAPIGPFAEYEAFGVEDSASNSHRWRVVSSLTALTGATESVSGISPKPPISIA